MEYSSAAADDMRSNLRRLVSVQLNWPDGYPSSSMLNSDEPRHALTITPDHSSLSHHVTAYLVDVGVGEQVDDAGVVTVRLPEPWAAKLATLVDMLGCTVTRH